MKNILLMSISLLLFSTSVLAKQEKLKAAIFNIAPWGYLDKDNNIAGIEYEIIKAISTEMNEEIDIKLVPYKRMMYYLKTGDVDFSIFFRSEKSELAAEPIIKWGALDIVIISNKETPIKNYSDLKKRSTCVRLGGYFSDKFDKDDSIKKVHQQNYSRCIALLKQKKVDGVIGTAATLFYELKQQDYPISALASPMPVNMKEDWIHFSRKSEKKEKQEKLKAAVNKLIENGTFSKIFSKYLPKKWHHIR